LLLYTHIRNIEICAKIKPLLAYSDFRCQTSASLDIIYLDEDIQGSIDLKKGTIKGDFSKYVVPVITEWYSDHRTRLIQMWDTRTPELIEAWD